jgi:hypothetical protein
MQDLTPVRCDTVGAVNVSNEDKGWWVEAWRAAEDVFVENVAPYLGLAAAINPTKASDPYAPDLIVAGSLADLKCQSTPFFRARELYGLDPRFVVTFNRKDYERYRELYPEVVVYFWVAWTTAEKVIGGRTFSVEPMRGVWRVPFAALNERIDRGEAPLHAYRQRVGDTKGNALDSFLFDLNSFECLAYRDDLRGVQQRHGA